MAMLMMKKTRMVPFLTCWLLVISQVHTDQDIGDSLSWSEEEVAVVESCRQEAASLEERMRIADSFTHQGNQLSAQGMHHHAVLKWEIATTCDNRSNVPWNNMANSFFAMGNLSAATAAAEISFSIKADHMSSTTLGNAYRAHKMYERAEKTFLAGIKYCLDNKDRHEHPFWSLAMLYWDQGDYIEFLKYSKLGLDHLSRPECVETAEEQVPCHIPDFEIDLMTRVYEASVDLGKFLASHGRYQEAETNLEWAEYVAETYPAERLDVQLVRKHLTCLKCAADNTQHRSPCDSDLDACRASWRDTNGRYLRMMAVRAMGCEWRHREEDVRDLERIMMSPNMTALLNHTTEFYFECEKGRVCGAGAQPPLHMWGLPMSLESVLVMGKVQPLQLVDRMLVDGPPPAVGVPDVEPEHRDCAEDRPLVQRPPARPSCGEHDAPRAAPARPVQDGRHRLSRPRVAAVRGEQGGERARAGGGQVPHDRAGPPCHALLRRAGVGGRSRHCQLSRDLHPLRPYRLHSRSPSGYLRSPPCPRAGALPWLHGEHGSSLDPVVRGGQMDCASRACKLLQREACSHARVLPGPFPSALLPVRWQRGERLQ
uniref:Uncharacterized protein n=1 Tax=Guillardia theta TaxID=55529 RepID=A0A7S4KEL4_GUITH|mmetsp:Transcript_23169/g.75380  ORF Transcript_23169/g.75380 Transcript_23169/m.75380 type:complete len:597 (+) Transcript_23169:180-1970(+)